MTTSARDAFDTVGDDEDLTDEQIERLMKQLEANLLDHGDDPCYEGVLDLNEDALLERLGLVDDDGPAFEARWGDDA
jgi:hypothetical protein